MRFVEKEPGTINSCQVKDRMVLKRADRQDTVDGRGVEGRESLWWLEYECWTCDLTVNRSPLKQWTKSADWSRSNLQEHLLFWGGRV
ncbi:hypothetical protein BBD39_05560 [Arsenophonus endosymbiont of Bemisia tabaci Asia II 3]|nr:hypothetical protein BBD39_05560 [Arsenophonus endosymbiont of Bemisia tabaci Asia II 3]